VQVPFLLAPSEAAQLSQDPPQAELQQKPSAQWLDWHCPSRAQIAPLVWVYWQVWFAAQYAPVEHWLSPVQVAGQLAAPEQRNGAHEGLPTDPETPVQMPSVPEPCATEQKSQAPEQAEEQQTPSAQWLELHWRSWSQVAPRAWFGAQWPVASQ
jgi:hypothetical protein